jgi:hypothetical protein
MKRVLPSTTSTIFEDGKPVIALEANGQDAAKLRRLPAGQPTR